VLDVDAQLAQIELVLARMEHVASDLQMDDPGGCVFQSTQELSRAFGTRAAVEPAAQRMRDGLAILRRTPPADAREPSPQQTRQIDHLHALFLDELLPMLRRVGFDL
jgi:hypothetical protein